MNSLSRHWAYSSRIPLTVVCIGLGLALFLLSRPGIEEGTQGDFWCDGAAWLALLSGVQIRIWATRSIAGRKGREVVCDGLYSLCRNPLYWGTLLLAISAFLFLKSASFVAVCLLPILLYPLAVVPAEEEYLQTRLGDNYAEYCRRVPRWWPRLRGYQSIPSVAASGPALLAEIRRSVWWLLIPVALELLCRLRTSPVIPKLWPFP